MCLEYIFLRNFFILVLFQMISSIIIFPAIICSLLVISSSYGNNMFPSNDDRFDVAHDGWNIENVPEHHLEKRNSGRTCVKCKLGLINCCAPNICVKKHLRPDRCMRIKQGK
jgi:hypothetical protein